MRATLCLLLVAAAAAAQDLPITRLAGLSFQIADLEKARRFYTGILGLEEAFDLKDSTGAIQSAFFKVNDDQYVEFSPGAAENFQLRHVSLLTPDLKKMAALLRERGITPGAAAQSPDGNQYFAIQDPDQTELHFVTYLPAGQQARHRGQALGARRVTDHLQHAGLAADHEAAAMALYQDKLGFREFIRGGPNPPEIRWINLAMPATPGDIVELMILSSQPAQGRRHIGFEVPDIQRAFKQLQDQGLPPGPKPIAGLNNRWILNLRDPNGLRVEFMGEAVR